MGMRGAIGVLVLVAAILAGGQIQAQEQPSDETRVNEGPLAAAPAQPPVSLFDAAMQLADLGREQEDPILLIAAARAVVSVGRTPSEDEAEIGEVAPEEEPKSADDEAAAAAGPEEQIDLVDRLLADARLYARGDEAVLAAITETETLASRGTVRGPRSRDMRLNPRRYREFVERYRGGQLAEAAIVGLGYTDVDLYVYDQNGNLVCRSISINDREYCRWTPLWNGNFRIRVVNLGYARNAVRLLVN